MGRAEEVQQQHNNNNDNNKRLLPKSNVRSVHCFICSGADGSAQQDLTSCVCCTKEPVSPSTGGSVLQAGFQVAGSQLEAGLAFPALVGKMSFIPHGLRKPDDS